MEWWEWVLIAVLILLALGFGGYAKRLSKECKETAQALTDLLGVWEQAIQDDNISKEEWTVILNAGKKLLQESKDVGVVVGEIVSMVIRKKAGTR